MYLQTDELKNKDAYDKAMAIVRDSDIDLIVFPEFCYVPGMPNPKEIDMASADDMDRMYNNSSKSNSLPSWTKYFSALAEIEYKAYELKQNNDTVANEFNKIAPYHLNNLRLHLWNGYNIL